MDRPEFRQPVPPQPAPDMPVDAERPDDRPWEEIEAGRFLPRRIRGSCRGMELG